MGITKGSLTARRYKVLGEPPEGFRVSYPEALNAYGFQEPFSKVNKEEVVGWVLTRNLLDAEFDDLNDWLFNHYALFQMRVDKKSLPTNYFKAHLEKKVEAWCEENSKERCPRNVKTELKDLLEFEWLQTALPTVKVTEVVWNMAEGYVLFHSLSEAANDRFRKLFHQTFGLKLMPVNPLDQLGDEELIAALEATGGSDLRLN